MLYAESVYYADRRIPFVFTPSRKAPRINELQNLQIQP